MTNAARKPKHGVAVARIAARSLIGASALLVGCGASPTALSQRPHPAKLQVVHVVSESRLLAGFPIRWPQFATTTRLQPFMIAVVEGYPMPGRDAPSTKREAAALPSYWTTLWGRGLQMAANRIDADLAVAAGDRVSVGGFFLPRRDVTPVSYLDVPRSIVPGVVAVAPEPGDAHLGVILVPPGNYSAFIGGPVASHDAAGDVRVWGAIVGAPPTHPSRPATWLVVQRLH